MTEKQLKRQYPLKNQNFYEVIFYTNKGDWRKTKDYYYKTLSGAIKKIKALREKHGDIEFQIRIYEAFYVDDDNAYSASSPFYSCFDNKININKLGYIL